MNVQQLKNSLLQMAVQGKLVSQNPKDEPAKNLLEKIKQEKEKLIQEKKIKADKNPSVIFRGEDNLFYETINNTTKCIQEEIPFDIPDSWEWVRLGEVCTINPRNNCNDDLEAGFMPMTLLYEGYNNQHDFSIKKWKEIKQGFTHFANNDLVIAKITPCFQNRKSAIIKNLPNKYGAGTTELHVIRLFHNLININYILWFVKTVYFIDNGIKAFTGTAGQQRINKDYVANSLFPLPPLEEQKRIVAKIESFKPLLEEYAEADNALQKMEKSFPDMIKKSLLQWAVQGKLVPQNPKDEPAKNLLEKIKQEKEKLIQEKKIKADKNPSVIFRGEDNLFYETINNTTKCIQEEIPFDIPDSWEWVRLGEICNLYTGNSINQNEKNKNFLGIDTGRPYIATKDITIDNVINYDNGIKIPESYNKFKVAKISSVLLCIEGGSAGRKMGLTMQEVCFGNKLCCFYNSSIIMQYLFYYLQSPTFAMCFNKKLTGIIGGVSINLIKTILFPLPPLEEQKRIAQKITELQTILTPIQN